MITAGLLIKATVVVLMALAGTWSMRGSRAAARHVVLTAAFAGLLALPIASVLGPTVAVPVALPTTPIEPAILGPISGSRTRTPFRSTSR